MKKESIIIDPLQINDQQSSDFFPCFDHQRHYQKLIAAFNEGTSLLIVTGASGLGKNFLLRRIIQNLGHNTQTINIRASGQSYDEFIDAISKKSGFDISNESTSTLTKKLDFLTHCFCSLTVDHFIIHVSHAEKTSIETLETILFWAKSLALNNNQAPSIHIVLTGLPALKKSLEKSGLQKLNLNLFAQCQLNPLNKEEILDYIKFHLNRSKIDRQLFDQGALQRIIFYSQGNMGLINKLCDLGLLTISLAEDSMVTSTVIDELADSSLSIQNRDKLSMKPDDRHDILPKHSEKSELLDLLSPSTHHPAQTDQPAQSPLLDQLLSEQRQGVKTRTNTLKNDVSSHQQRIKIDESTINHPDNLFSLSEKGSIQGDNEDIQRETHQHHLSSFPKTVPLQKIKVSSSSSDKRYKHSSKSSPLPRQKSFFIGLIMGAIASIATFLFVNQPTGDSFLKNRSSSESNVSNIQIIKRAQPSRLSNTVSEDTNKKAIIHTLDAQLPARSVEETVDNNASAPVDAANTDELEKATLADLQMRIDNLLLQADQQFAKKQLLTPSDDNAWQTYQEILALDPDNQPALAGIDKITRTYIVWAQEEIKKGNYLNADYLYKKALKVSPDDSDALSGLSELEKKRRDLRQPSSATEQTALKSNQNSNSQDIDALLKLAEQQFAKKQLMTPPEDSAWQTYQTILSQDPENKQALAGIAKIAHTYVIWAKEEIKRGNPEHAEYLFNKALEVAPGDSDAIAGLTTLKQ